MSFAALLRVLMRALRALGIALVALVVFLEEWGWEPLARWMGRLAQWPPLARLEQRIAQVPPRWALALFLVPALALFPVKLLALWLMHAGRAALGVAVILLAKLVGTALLGRLFMLTEPQLRSFAWLDRALDAWSAYKARVRALVGTWMRRSLAWRTMRRTVRRWFQFLRT